VTDQHTGGYVQHFGVVSTPGVSGRQQQIAVGSYSYGPVSALRLDDVVLVPAINLIQNGGFETGNFSSWQLGGNTVGIAVSSLSAYSGLYVAALGSVGSSNLLSLTEHVVAGASHSLQFWVSTSDSGATPISLQVITKFKSHAAVSRYNATDLPDGYRIVCVVLPAFPSADSLKLSFVWEDTLGTC
jgi:hypothetical protein